MALCAYSVDVSSKFSFFIEDENNLEADPEEIFEKVKRESEQQKADKKDVKKGKQKPKPVEPVQQQVPVQPIKEKALQNSQSNKPPRLSKPKVDIKEEQVVPVAAAAPVEATQPSAPTGDSRPNVYFSRGRGQRGGGRGSGMPRNDFFVPQEQNMGGEIRRGNYIGGNRANYRGRGRAFERHSGSVVTGVKAIDKRGGSGRNNWGNPEEDGQNVANQEISDSQLEVVLDAQIHADVEKPDIEQVIREPVNDNTEDNENREPPQLTLEEYFASRSNSNRLDEIKQKINQKKKHVLPVMKSSEFAGMTPYIKEIASKESSDEEDEVIEIESKHKQLMDVNLRFGPPPRGGRGSRGGGQFRGSRGSINSRGRGGRVSTGEIMINNAEEFPALS